MAGIPSIHSPRRFGRRRSPVRIGQRRVRVQAVSTLRRNGQHKLAAQFSITMISHKRLLLCKPADYEKRCAERGRTARPPGMSFGARNGRLTAVFQLV
jgi:hypothetical protein